MLSKFKTLAFCAVPLLFVACGSGEENYLVDACVDAGDSREMCECTARIMTEELSEDQLAMMVSMAKLQADGDLSEQEAQAKMMEEYNMAELMALGMASIGPAMKAQSECQ